MAKHLEGTDFEMLLGPCQAVADHPCCVFENDSVQAYPEAKVILTTRLVSDWYQGVMATARIALVTGEG